MCTITFAKTPEDKKCNCFAWIFFKSSFDDQKKSQLYLFLVFGHLLRNFLTLWTRNIGAAFRCIQTMGPEGYCFGPFWLRIGLKLGKASGFRARCKTFPVGSHETCVFSSLKLLLSTCRIWAPRDDILGHFLSKLCRNMSKLYYYSLLENRAK